MQEDRIERNNDLHLSLILPLPGGKGGFGSMLKAIGAQIEKTTNKDACRDLSGRRLRDVNAEKRIKNWIKRKSDQQKEQQRKKREKLERLTQQPKIEFKDDDYLKQKDVIPQKVDDAIDYILNKKKQKLSTSTSTVTNATVDDQQPCTSSSSNDNQQSTSSSSSENENLIISNLESSEKTNSDGKEAKFNRFKTIKRKQDEPAVASKKKKVQLWLGDNLDSNSDDSDEN